MTTERFRGPAAGKATGRATGRSRARTRHAILTATEALLRTRGLAGVTTREIARYVGRSEGALYVHFNGRLSLLLAALEECLPDMQRPLAALEGSVGSRTPAVNLERAIRGVYQFQRRVIPVFGSLFAEPALLRGYQRSLRAQDRSPRRAVAAIARYIAAEQKRGRLAAGADP